MTDKERRFCDEYLIDGNATQAALRAGYSACTATNASRWLDPNSTKKYKPEVDEYIKAALEQLHNEKTADAREVMEYLSAVMRGEHKEQALALAGEGTQEIVDIDVSARERLKAAELLGKRYGLFKDGISLEGSVPVIIRDDLGDTDEQ